MIEEPSSWVCISFAGTMIYLPADEENIVRASFKEKDENFVGEDVHGTPIAINFKLVEAFWVSTPDTRAKAYILEAQNNARKKEVLREAGFTDFDV